MHRFFIKRPITTWMFMLSFLLLGIYSYINMPRDRFPDVDFPMVAISTVLPGATPYVVDRSITKRIEDELATISGIEAIISRSSAGLSQIVIIFDLDKNIDTAVEEVRDAVQRAKIFFPEGTQEPLILRVNTSAAPIMAILLYGDDNVSFKELSYYAKNLVQRELQKINGVGEVDLGGYRDLVMWVRLEPEKLFGYGLTPLDVVNVIKANNLEIPSGEIHGRDRDYLLRLYGKVRGEEDLRNIQVREDLRLSELAKVKFDFDEEKSITRFKGKRAIAIIVYKQSKTNTVRTANRVKEKLKEIERKLPKGMHLSINYDSSEFIKRAVREATEEIVIGSFLAGVAVFLFLGSFKFTLIPFLAIPISVFGSIFFMDRMGFSLNMISLIGFAVAIGLVIDDAIVVLESIYRRMEEGLKPLEASDKGTQVVMFAILASTASLIVIFVPIIFLKGVIGQFLSNFATAIVLSIAISYLVSITFTPMLSARLVRVQRKNFFMRAYESFEERFDLALKWALEHKKTILTVSLLSVLVGCEFAGLTKKEFHPVIDEGRFMIRFETPIGSSLEYTNQKAREIEKVLNSIPYIEQYSISFGQGIFGRAGKNGGVIFVKLVDRRKRPHQVKVMELVRERLQKIEDLKVSVERPSVVGAGAGRMVSLQYVIKGPSLEELRKIAKKLTEELKRRGGYADVDTDIRVNKPEVRIYINRRRAEELGVSVYDIASTLRALFGDFKVGTFDFGSETYDIKVKASEDFLKDLDNLKRVYVRSREGKLIPLAYLIDYKVSSGYETINRFNRQYSFILYANLVNKSQGEAVREVESILKRILPPGYTYEVSGYTKEFKRAFKNLFKALIIAIIGVYMVLASLFESLIHPFTVLLTLPLATSGAFGLLYFTNTSLSVPSYFGIILLVGIVARDSVLFIERIVQLRKEGYPIREAILRARKERLRPILMTTLTIVFALIPVALGLTAGAEIRKPMAIAVIGGIFTALPLSLFVIPVIYEGIERWKKPS